ncbi:KdsC family phosphatase [Acidithiobacillus sp. M4-SHS-6]|uniref:KdsC family phosphatase n=1 Tax=Acidithiobacillus sp. M4-SHS-6 TaxID=3383024 RepID=UPI0039BEA0DA
MKRLTAELLTECAAQVRLLILDVDGVMTDGRLYFDDAGTESKAFHVRDGYGIKLLQAQGVELAIITARFSPAVAHRARDLGIKHLFQGCKDKHLAYSELKLALHIEDSMVAYMGDDLIDLPILLRVGLATAPADAHPELIQQVHWQSRYQGGRGAVRELCDLILQAKGCWPEVLAQASQKGHC